MSASTTTTFLENSLRWSYAILVVVVVIAIPPATVMAETVLPATSTANEALFNDESDEMIVEWDTVDDDDNDDGGDNHAVPPGLAWIDDSACRGDDEMTMSLSSIISTVGPD